MRQPKRIQMSRKKGARLRDQSDNYVVVARPSKWGNPFKVKYRRSGLTRFVPDAEAAIGHFKQMLDDCEQRLRLGYPDDINELRGKDLACWCPLDQPCHGDVLLEIANAPIEAGAPHPNPLPTGEGAKSEVGACAAIAHKNSEVAG